MVYHWKVSTGGVHGMEKSPHVHVHFLNGVRLKVRGAWVELCCHGCGVGQIVLYDSPSTLMDNDQVLPVSAVPEFVRFRDAFEEIHRACGSDAVAEECALVRGIVTTMDLREHGGPGGLFGECDCACHFAPIVHDDECCKPCRFCHQDIALSCFEEHCQGCESLPATLPELPVFEPDAGDDD
jgi:hypothetical protein